MLRKRVLRWSTVTLLLVLVAGLAGVPAFVQPQADPLRKADAILILGGYEYDRYRTGIGLVNDGWAPAVAVSNPNGEDDKWLTSFCAQPHHGFSMYCFAPDPPTTAGEAQELKRLSEQHGWHTVIVVTYRPHISRARYIVGQCFHGDLIMVPSPPRPSLVRWIYEYAYQTAGYLKAWLRPAC